MPQILPNDEEPRDFPSIKTLQNAQDATGSRLASPWRLLGGVGGELGFITCSLEQGDIGPDQFEA